MGKKKHLGGQAWGDMVNVLYLAWGPVASTERQGSVFQPAPFSMCLMVHRR